MDGAVFDAGMFSGAVPVFPLPDVVLFPHGLLPLHIFEPRYRAMTRAALEGERLIAMALLKPGWEKDYHGNPPIYEVMGMGRVIQDTRLSDGRYSLLLYGVARARVLEIVSHDPYRTARVEILRERPVEGEKYEEKRRALLAGAMELHRAALSAALPEVPLGVVCDLLAGLLRIEPALKQSLLEDLDAGVRCDRLLGFLRQQAAARRLRRPPSASLN